MSMLVKQRYSNPAHLDVSQLAGMSLSRDCGQAGVDCPDLVACHLIPVAKVNEHDLQPKF